MKNLMIKGFIKTQQIKGALLSPLMNKRGDDNSQEAGRGVGKTLGLVIVVGAGVAFITYAVAKFNGGMTSLGTTFDKFKTVIPATPSVTP